LRVGVLQVETCVVLRVEVSIVRTAFIRKVIRKRNLIITTQLLTRSATKAQHQACDARTTARAERRKAHAVKTTAAHSGAVATTIVAPLLPLPFPLLNPLGFLLCFLLPPTRYIFLGPMIMRSQGIPLPAY